MVLVLWNRNGDKAKSEDNYSDHALMGNTGGENKKFPSEMRERFCFYYFVSFYESIGPPSTLKRLLEIF